MKETSANEKTNTSRSDTAAQRASAGPEGMSIAPPAYGIESLDSLSVRAAPIQRMAGESAAGGEAGSPPTNRTGLPDSLKSGVESLSGYSLDDVRVHYNSSKPAQLQALAYTQGADIHVGPGQERHLPHEAWHVVQQKQGRVRATMQMKGASINDDVDLENEATVMGQQATLKTKSHRQAFGGTVQRKTGQGVVQRKATFTVAAYAHGASGALDLTQMDVNNFAPESANYESTGTVQIRADTDTEAQQWDAGYVQTIYKGEIKTKYKNAMGEVKAMHIVKTETARDGDAGDEPWYEVGTYVDGTPGQGQFSNRTANVAVKLEDQPFNVRPWDATDKLGNAVGFAEMSGRDTFGTWLIARESRNEDGTDKRGNKKKEYLKWETWYVDWGITSTYWSTGLPNLVATSGRTVHTGSGNGKGRLVPEYRTSSANDDLITQWVKT